MRFTRIQIHVADVDIRFEFDLPCPDGVGKVLQVTGSVYGGTSIRSKLINSLSAANYSAPIIVDATPINASHLSLVQGKGIGKMIGKLILACF